MISLKWLLAQSTTPTKFWTGNIAPKTLKQKIMLTFVKTFKVEFPVWIDGVRTDEKETRIKLLFREETEFRGQRVVRYGSAVIMKDWTEEMVLENYSVDEDLSAYLKMGEPNEKGFCKVLPR